MQIIKIKLLGCINHRILNRAAKKTFFVNIEDYSKTHLETYAQFSVHMEKSFDKLRELAIRSTSRWYSNCKVLQIMNSYSEMNNISYDYVFQGRLDLLF